MAYVVKEDFIRVLGEEKLVELTDLDGEGVVDDETLGRAVRSAEGVFDSYVSTRYVVPIDPPTEVVKSVVLALAIYELFSNRVEMPEGVYKIRKDRRDQAIKLLEAVQSGKAALAGATLIVTPGTGSVGVGAFVFDLAKSGRRDC